MRHVEATQLLGVLNRLPVLLAMAVSKTLTHASTTLNGKQRLQPLNPRLKRETVDGWYVSLIWADRQR
jgi:hypothetical protein